MIAHRLTTIASADNLLYFKSRSQLISASKGSPEYAEIFEKLKCIQYAYGDTDKDKEGDEDEDSEVEDVIEEEEVDSDDEDIKPGQHTDRGKDQKLNNKIISSSNSHSHNASMQSQFKSRNNSLQESSESAADDAEDERFTMGGNNEDQYANPRSMSNSAADLNVRARTKSNLSKNSKGARERLLSDNDRSYSSQQPPSRRVTA